jgi:hypothetical protein
MKKKGWVSIFPSRSDPHDDLRPAIGPSSSRLYHFPIMPYLRTQLSIHGPPGT